MLRVKSAFRREVVVFLLLAPFLAAAVMFAVLMGEAWLTKRALARHIRTYPGLGDRGRVRFLGDARREAPVTSPAGASGIAWVASVGYMASSKSSTWFEPICTRADVSDLLFGHEYLVMRLTFARPSETVALASTNDLRHDLLPQIDLGEVKEAAGNEIPAAMKQACAGPLAATSKTLLYREAVLQNGDHLEILGCTSDGLVLEPCRDGLDLVSRTPLDDRISARRGSVQLMVTFGCAWNLFVVGITAALVASRRVRAKQSVDETLRGAAS